MIAPITALGVVIPARNEVELVGAALDAVDRACRPVRAAGVDTAVLLVADACSDTTADTARAAATPVLEIDARNVGIARESGTREMIERFAGAGHRPEAVWIAHTDADSRVPGDWLTDQVAAADAGWDVVAGEVAVEDWTGHSLEAVQRFLLRYRRATHMHVHGANLGFRAERYRSVGGFAPLAVGEDRQLVEAMAADGARVLAAATAVVHTSARRIARARGGFAAALADAARPCVGPEPMSSPAP